MFLRVELPDRLSYRHHNSYHFLKDDFLQNGESRFEIDKVIENQLMITAAPDGFLRRKKISNNNRGRS